ncbi:MAG: hypothetical protein WED07_00430 [Candidatus Freyarchaeum deiterrae]
MSKAEKHESKRKEKDTLIDETKRRDKAFVLFYASRVHFPKGSCPCLKRTL